MLAEDSEPLTVKRLLWPWASEPMTRKEDTGAPTFSRDVLRIEKNGLNEENLTLIDVPGIFENESPGLTTKSDIEMVKDMVTSYIKESRTM